MGSANKSSRKTLADKFFMDEKSLKSLTNRAIDFLIYSNPKNFEILFDSTEPRIVMKKANEIKDYFKTTGENSSEYKGKIKRGKLYLTTKQFENYVSKKTFF